MRVRFSGGGQRSFLERIQQRTGTSASVLAEQLGVCARTVCDWRRERWQLTDVALEKLCELAQLPRPNGIELLPEYWSVQKASRLGGLRHVALYGPPGTPEGRRRGGLAAQAIFQARTSVHPKGGWKLRKPILVPARGEELAEFMGIMLGDGCIRNPWQAGVSFNQHGDRPHAEFIRTLIKQLFGLDAAYYIRPSSADLIISSAALVSFLQEQGFPKGSKCETLTQVPRWIQEAQNLRNACLRGLMDTDGCVFRHRYRINGKEYSYPKLAFAAAIPCLTQFVLENLQALDIPAYVHQQGQRVFVYSRKAVVRYFKVIGTHNPRYRQRFEEYAYGS